MYKGKAVCVLIPAFNEEKSITKTIKAIPGFVDKILVIDDGSHDHTYSIASELCGNRTFLIRNMKNRGYGGAIIRGFKEILKFNSDIVVLCDADGQYDADEIRYLIEPLSNNSCDLVTGTRFLSIKNKIPIYRKFGIWMITSLLNNLFNLKYSDSQCGFRAFSSKAIDNMNLNQKGMNFSLETLICAKKQGIKVREVPVHVSYKEIKHGALKSLNHGLQLILYLILKDHDR